MTKLGEIRTYPAQGIHDHEIYKLGAAPPLHDRRALMAGDFITEVPDHPLVLDDLSGVNYGLDGNDRFGVCVPTGWDNYRRMVTKMLTGTEVEASQQNIWDWYKTQNPKFDPNNYDPANDQGMVIQLFLEYLVKQGLILGFAKLDTTNDDQMRAASYLFLGLIIAVNLEVAQQTQTGSGTWDYSPSGEWGGHCVLQGAYQPGAEDCISWVRRIHMTDAFRENQLEEAWVVILPEHAANASFRAGWDFTKYAAAYKKMTGKEFPGNQPTPTPPPAPNPPPVLSIPITDGIVQEHLTRAAHKTHDGDIAAWTDHHFKSYFKLH